MSTFDPPRRYAPGGVTDTGDVVFTWQLTPSHITDPVILQLPPKNVLPVIFVPGIMGSNLQSNGSNGDPIEPVWVLNNPTIFNTGKLKDHPIGLAWATKNKKPGDRQRVLHPARVDIYPGGAVPEQTGGSVHELEQYTRRGWGEVGEGSYHGFLLWLEQVLNGQGYNPARWPQFSFTAMSATPEPGAPIEEPKLPPNQRMAIPGLAERAENGPIELLSDELLARAQFRMPVYACGYNWLDSNIAAAKRLSERILRVIDDNNRFGRCSQVILITHSMGGLVARACQQLPGMQDAIAGIVHGVMPAVGAAVAYRRCKIGMRDEDAMAGLVIGETGQDVTAVFAQAPGALQLLPTAQYHKDWLTIDAPSGRSILREPNTGDPYQDIYLRRDRWWGLVREEWLSPPGGIPLWWDIYKDNIELAREFHEGIRDAYHPHTYVFYGKDPHVPSFEGIHWQLQPGAIRPDDRPSPFAEQVSRMDFADVRDDGNNPLRVGGRLTTFASSLAGGPWPSITTLNSSYWDLICAKQDGGGDGTVPVSSGAFPLRQGGGAIQQQLGLAGIEHEPAYHDEQARLFTLHALQKIAAKAKVSP